MVPLLLGGESSKVRTTVLYSILNLIATASAGNIGCPTRNSLATEDDGLFPTDPTIRVLVVLPVLSGHNNIIISFVLSSLCSFLSLENLTLHTLHYLTCCHCR